MAVDPAVTAAAVMETANLLGATVIESRRRIEPGGGVRLRVVWSFDQMPPPDLARDVLHGAAKDGGFGTEDDPVVFGGRTIPGGLGVWFPTT